MKLNSQTLLLCVCLNLFGLALSAQNIQLSGTVQDSQGDAISLADVVLSKAVMETKGNPGFNITSTTLTVEDGGFVLTELEAGTYIIQVSSFGFKSNRQRLSLTESTHLGAITLTESIEELDETVISAKRPILKKEPGKLVFTIVETSIATGDAVQVLSKTPGVFTFGDKITIKNKAPVVYINDKRLYIPINDVYAFLKGMDGSTIERVEVITNPSAKYDADGSMVLSIFTSKNVSTGYKGTINGTYEQAVYPKYLLGTTHFFKNKWLDLSVNYSFSPRKEFKDQDDKIQFFTPGNAVYSRWESNFARTTNSNAHQGTIDALITLDDKNSIRLSSTIFNAPNTEYDNAVSAEIRNVQFQLDSTFTTIGFLSNDKSNVNYELAYLAKLGDKGAGLNTRFTYIDYDDSQFQQVGTRYFAPQGMLLRSNGFHTNANQNSNIFVGSMDATIPLKEAQFLAGIKYTNSDSKSALDFFEIENAVTTFNPELSDQFSYDESIYAAYLSYNQNWKKWSIDGGLRAEYTNITGNSIALGQVNTDRYFELFPSISLQHQLNENNSLGISYARRISRPKYQSLNPFKYFLNENNFNSGNPELFPAIDNKITLSYGLKDTWFFDFYYHHTDKTLSTLTFQDNTAQIIRTTEANLIRDFQYSLDVTYAKPIANWLYLSVYTSAFYFENEFYALESEPETYINNTFGFYAQMYSGWTISKIDAITADLTVVYLSDYIYGSYTYGNQFNLSLSFRKGLWNKRASIQVGVEDMFNTYNVPISSKYYNQNNSYFPQPETRLFRIGFTYKLGNSFLKNLDKRGNSQEGERLKKE